MAVGAGTLLDQALPVWEVAERHQRAVRAPAEEVWAALLSTQVRDLRPSTIAELRRPLPDGWVRIGMDFRLAEHGPSTLLRTETRVLATGPRSRRWFGANWTAIRPGGGLIRRELLRAVARRAEAAR
jgi:hypothetical protein